MSYPPTSSLHQQANQKESINLSFYKKNIQLSPRPRSETPTYKWDNRKWKTAPDITPAKCLNDLLWSKHLKFFNEGPASLVGKVAVDIAQSIVKDGNRSRLFSGITFRNQYGNDIMVFGGLMSYKSIIERMKQEGMANLNTAIQILTNLSKNYNHNPEEIFTGLDGPAKRLMAFLICETIRFQDDGACARMAMRMVIDKYKTLDPNSSDPFKDVFVSSQFYDAVSIFAINGGKQRMINQIMGDFLADDPSKDYFVDDKNKVNQIQSDYYSDDEGPPPQSNSNFNTSNESSNYVPSAPYAVHPMVKKDRVRTDRLYKDPSSNSSASSTANSTPSRKTSHLSNFPQPLTNSGLSDTENNNDNYREEEAQHEFGENQAHTSDHEEEYNDSMGPSPTINSNFVEVGQETVCTHRHPRFCGNCKLFYNIEGDNEHLKTCPKCRSKVKKIRRAHLSLFINGISKWEEAKDLPSGLEGYYIRLDNLP